MRLTGMRISWWACGFWILLASAPVLWALGHGLAETKDGDAIEERNLDLDQKNEAA